MSEASEDVLPLGELVEAARKPDTLMRADIQAREAGPRQELAAQIAPAVERTANAIISTPGAWQPWDAIRDLATRAMKRINKRHPLEPMKPPQKKAP